MPPKRKRPPPAPESEPGSSPPRASSELQEEEGEEEAEEEPETRDASSLLFNTTFSAYRVSPLHVGRDALDAASFQTLSKRLRDTLVGDIVRGVQVGLSSDDGGGALGRAGVLEGVGWRWVALGDLLGDDHGRGARDASAELGARDADDAEEENGTAAATGRQEKARGINHAAEALAVELQYENAAFSALLLPDVFASSAPPPDSRGTWTSHSSIPAPPIARPNDQDGKFHHLPLLLLRMPVPLKSVLIEFLCRTFDARVAPLRLGTRTLVSSWERWLALSGPHAVRRLNKDVALTLGFHLEPPPAPGDGGGAAQPPAPAEKRPGKPAQQLGLKTLDLIIPAPDVRRFLRAGADLADTTASAVPPAAGSMSPTRRRQLAGGLDDEGWGWRAASAVPDPFTEALHAYLAHHLALDLFHPGVRVLKIACDGFSISEGRVKLFRPASPAAAHAAAHVLGRLVDKARGRTDWMAVSFS